MSNQLFHTIIQTPLGNMDAMATNEGICLLEFHKRKELQSEIETLKTHFKAEVLPEENEHLKTLKKELKEYFEKRRQTFSVPIIFQGTEFQQKVWTALLDIPFGETRTYTEQTAVLGDPKAIRAVASANGRNKMSIIVPCHRVIGANGSLTGYAGGLENKRFLLNLEREVAGPKDLFNS